jgi:outer membrane protein TolC
MKLRTLCLLTGLWSVLLPSLAAGDVNETLWAQRLGLPPLLPTREVITALPQVQAARAGVDLALAREQGLQAGVHEWTLRAGAQERSETAGPRYIENDVALERNFRWGGKAQTDRRIGEAGVAAARSGYADTWHESVRSLLQGWYDWQRARSAALVQTWQTDLAQEQLAIAARRVKAGDVPRLDELMAQAELDRQKAQQQQAAGQEAMLRAELQKRHPGLALEAAGAGETDPNALQLPDEATKWVQRILDDNHEIELAEAQVRVARLRSERAGQDRMADPLLGVRAARERGGAENIVGVYIGIPLTGNYRASEQRATLAELDAAEQRLLQTRQRVGAAAERVVLRAAHALATWQRLAAVEQAMARVSQLGMKAYSLGEMTLTEALQSRRTALDAALTAEAARWEALEAVSRVLVDAHRLWAADEGQH